ncbi:T9SS type A sorting domain-containing protein [Algibacter mikhailovii]|uniref:Secretion system C-terminal sorting domain-containing protein n=1 Tax=Algibacter mikhailovii TaxID=425498 RepID=A0A918RAN7_9FLAO|nr:T9SS type A sorting domain-containing protein [Algibacter mikhailovii]GGZ91856.1 hypothetical protein GCM10007028_32840 [Algibacter mikhailovii]
MNKNPILALSCILFALILKAQDTKNVLFLGNSYTFYNDLPALIEQLASSNGDTFTHGKNTMGFYSLIEHANNNQSVDLINASDWDHVVLQEFSTLPAYTYLDFYDGASQLLQLINPSNTCLNKAILYMTWGRENSTDYPYNEHQQLTTDAYNTMAESFKTEVSPVGVAWKKVRDDNDPINLYDPDGSHPSYAGSYLAACVFYATIFDKSPVGLSFTGSLSKDDASYLQQKAFEAYNDYVALGLIHTGNAPDTITQTYTAQLNNTYFELNALATGSTMETSFDFTFTGSSTESVINTNLEYVISQQGTQIANGSVPISMNLTPNQCASQTETYPLNIDLSNVGKTLFHLELFLDGKLINDYMLSKTVTALADTSWKLATIEKALAEGPTLRNYSGWWYNTTQDITVRACQFDDQIIFNADGTFQNILENNTWRDSWQGVAEGCGIPVAPHDGSTASSWLYNTETSSITLTGLGAFVGLPGAHNTSKLKSPSDAVNLITYSVLFEEDLMYTYIDHGNGFYRFVFKKEPSLSIANIKDTHLFNFHPNPATTEIQIQSDHQIEALTIYDLTGKILFTQQDLTPNTMLNISQLKRGLYILKASIGNKTTVKKLAIH